MSGYIKYFKNGGKNMSFLIKDDEVLDKYDKIWDVIKGKLGISFHSESVYEYRYLYEYRCLHNYWFCFENR